MKGSLKEYQGMTPERISEGILEINSGGFSGVSLEEFLKESWFWIYGEIYKAIIREVPGRVSRDSWKKFYRFLKEFPEYFLPTCVE